MTVENDQKCEQQIENLRNNHKRWHAETVATFKVDNGATLLLQRQKRDYGRQCYYAVTLSGEPVAYVLGDAIARGKKTRHVVLSTFVTPAWRGQNLTYAVYKAIIAAGDVLVSDWDRTSIMDHIWEKLQRDLPKRNVMRFDNRYVALLTQGCQ